MAAFKYYLGGIEIEEPEGFNGAIFEKQRHEKYGGFWGEIGLSEGESSAKIKFTDEVSVQIIKEEFEKRFLNSNLTFRVEDCTDDSECNGLTYIVDFSDYEEDCCSVSVTFRSEIGDTVRSRINVKYEVIPDSKCSIPTKDLEGSVNYEIINDLSVVNLLLLPNHLVPITGIVDAESETEYNYVNDGIAKGIDVVGVLKWEAESSSLLGVDYEVQVAVFDANGNFFEVIQQNNFLTNNNLESLSFGVNNYILQPFFKIQIRVLGIVNSVVFQFTWSVSSNNTDGLIIREHKTQNEFSIHDGITIKNAFEQLVFKISGGQLKFCSNYLDKCDDKWITNGFNLKGIKRNLNLSLDDLFNGLNPIDSIEMGIRGNCLYLDKKVRKEQKQTVISGDYEVGVMVNKENLYSKISIGYKEWKSETIFGNDEVCSSREYVTDYSFETKELKLESTFIASHYLIEKIKRQEGRDKADDKYDDEVFIVCVVNSFPNYKAETTEGFSLIDGVIYPQNTINLRISPARNLQRHLNYTYLSGSHYFASGTGNYNAIQNQNYVCGQEKVFVTENQDFVFSDNLPKFASKKIAYIKIPECTISAYCNLKEKIIFEYCGKIQEGYLKRAEMTVDETPSMKLEVYF